ncbi:MAG: hypothetical protein Q9213_001016 [Squamulea squamosa]
MDRKSQAVDLPGLGKAELSLLRRKQAGLASTKAATLASLPSGFHHRTALEATLIFTSYEAGTAVCIHPDGWILTCAHCIGESEKEWRANSRRWLLFYTGTAIQAECCAWNWTLDSALLRIIFLEDLGVGKASLTTFPYTKIATSLPRRHEAIICIGQPGRDDLESTRKRKTTYNLVEVSEGRFRDMVPGVDPCDNSEIGSLKHDAWTYWGHSGAPLIRAEDSTLVGLHSSWDEKTLMRHGVPLEAIRHFLQRTLVLTDQLVDNARKALAGLCSNKKVTVEDESDRIGPTTRMRSMSINIHDHL